MSTSLHPMPTEHPAEDDFWGPDLSDAPRLPLILAAICVIGAAILIVAAPRSLETPTAPPAVTAEAKPVAPPETSPMASTPQDVAAKASGPAQPSPAVVREQVRMYRDRELRAWTDRSGKQVMATMIGATPHSVTLATPDGKSRTFSRSAFSPADLAYVDWVLKPVSERGPADAGSIPKSGLLKDRHPGVPAPVLGAPRVESVGRATAPPAVDARVYAPSANRVAEYR